MLSICGLGWLDETEIQDIPGERQAACAGGGERDAAPRTIRTPEKFEDLPASRGEETADAADAGADDLTEILAARLAREIDGLWYERSLRDLGHQ